MAHNDRINELRYAMPYMSHTALSSVLGMARRGELPPVGSRTMIRSARDNAALQMTPYGSLTTAVHVTKAAAGAGTIPIDVSHFMPSLWTAAGCKYFSLLLNDAYTKKPCTRADPWHLVVYNDGVTPGNVLRQANSRKLDAIYFTLLELGPAALCKEDVWLTSAIMSLSAINIVAGGAAQVLGELLAAGFAVGGTNMHLSGFNVRLHDGTNKRLFIRMGGLLADELALHLMWQCKGAQGTKMCLLCLDVYNTAWIGAGADPDILTYDKVFTEGQCRLHTAATHAEVLRRLGVHKGTLTQDAFKNKESELGFTHSSYNLLTDPRLVGIVNAVDHTLFDWAHCVLQGVLGILVYIYLLALSPALSRASFVQFGEYMQSWTWPRRLESRAVGKDVFSSKRMTSHVDAKRVKFTMSEALSFIPVFRHWVAEVASVSRPDLGPLHDCVLSFLLFAQMLISSVRYSVDPDDVARTYEVFYRLFVNYFGAEHLIPKFHFIVHLPAVMRKIGWAINCIVCERKHKTVKRFAEPTMNPKHYARGVLREVIASQLAVLSQSSWLDLSSHLDVPRRCPAQLLGWLRHEFGPDAVFTHSSTARMNKLERCGCGDIIFFRFDGGELVLGCIWYLLSVDGMCFCIVDRYQQHSHTANASVWNVVADPCIILFSEVLDVCIHKFDSDRTACKVLHSYAYRCTLLDNSR